MFNGMKETGSKTIEVLLFIITIVLTIGIAFIIIEIHQHNLLNKNRFAYTLEKDFENDSRDTAIAYDIYKNKPIFIDNGGRWRDYDIDDYLGFYEEIESYIEAGSLTIRDVYDNFSYDIVAAYNNAEIRQYILSFRKKTKDDSYYQKFEKLATSLPKTSLLPLK